MMMQFVEWLEDASKCMYCDGLGFTICDACEGKKMVQIYTAVTSHNTCSYVTTCIGKLPGVVYLLVYAIVTTDVRVRLVRVLSDL